MNEKDLKAILAGGETEVIEFKENLHDSFYKNIAAFANADGGIILLGIDKNGRIKGTELSSRFLEDLTNRIVNNLAVYPNIETIAILKQFISVRYEIKGIQREDIWDYPIPALREAVLNAFILRDYFKIANFILIKVYDDRIWISNPGGLPEGITVDELKKPHKSYVRNPLIARAFYLTGYIEHYGSGTVRMAE